jgi:hypothetical protein
LRLIGGQTNAKKIAKTVWKATNKNKLHWKIGFTRLMAFHCWLLPFTVRFAVNLLAMPKIKK